MEAWNSFLHVVIFAASFSKLSEKLRKTEKTPMLQMLLIGVGRVLGSFSGATAELIPSFFQGCEQSHCKLMLKGMCLGILLNWLSGSFLTFNQYCLDLTQVQSQPDALLQEPLSSRQCNIFVMALVASGTEVS